MVGSDSFDFKISSNDQILWSIRMIKMYDQLKWLIWIIDEFENSKVYVINLIEFEMFDMLLN